MTSRRIQPDQPMSSTGTSGGWASTYKNLLMSRIGLDGAGVSEYNHEVRRILAILLLAVSSLSLGGPAVFAEDGDAKLPACCKRGGKHACVMTANLATSSGTALQAGRCPLFPVFKALPGRLVGLPGISGTDLFALLGLRMPRLEARVERRSWYRPSGHVRGPPSLLA